ncbi:MAG: phage tail terminator-like protein [Paracoccaceae bacterium]
MSVDGDLHAALMARVETITGYPVLYPQKGGDQPAGEYIAVAHLPNDNNPAELAGDVKLRQGFLVITLVSPLGVHEVVTRSKAGALAAYFPRADRLISGDVCVEITGYTVKPGRQEGQRWETPVWISYWCAS